MSLTYALENVRQQYEKYPFPAYSTENVKEASLWLKRLGIPQAGEHVLDVGCGTGLLSVAFSLSGARVKAIDFSHASLAIARRMADTFRTTIDFRLADLFSYEEGERFDVVYCGGVLHHTGNARNGFAKISRLVKDGGTLVVGLYNRGLSPIRLTKWLIRTLAGENIELRRHVALAIFSTPAPYLSSVVLSRLGAGFSGPELLRGSGAISPEAMWKTYVGELPNLVDLLCHAYTSYHTPREVEQWYSKEGFVVTNEIPSRRGLGALVSQLASNYIVYTGIKTETLVQSNDSP